MDVSGDSSKATTTNESKKDPGWKYVRMVKPPNTNDLVCNFCAKITKGRIYRAKQHIVGGFRNTKGCPKCPTHVREEIRDFMIKKAASSVGRDAIPDFDDIDTYGDDEEMEEIKVTTSSKSSKSVNMQKRPKIKGPMDILFATNAEKVVQERKKEKMKQTTINEACKKELRDKACRDIAKWMYDAAIPFNVMNYPSFAVMLESVGQFDVGLKPPSSYEVRVSLLNREVDVVKNSMKSYEDEWVKYGCSIMADGWTDKKQRTLINFLVNSPKGTVFLESVDASNYAKTGEKMLLLFDKMVEHVGESNVVQIVTDNASNNVLAGRLLEAKRPHLYWTPCAAHCIDLILEDIGKMSMFSITLKRAISVNSYIYVRPGVVNMLRHFTGQRELVRPGVTRFATAFLTLQRIHKQKSNLRKMFTSEEWATSKWAKELAGKKVTNIILMPSFWNNVVYMLKIFGPLVRVLRLVDGEKKPAMGYIYEAMDRAKEAIMNSFNEKEERYNDVFKIIDNRWENQLHRPLHATGYYLNPEFFYSNSSISQDEEVMKGFYNALQRLIPSHDEQDKISDQLILYRNAEGLFGLQLAIRHRTTKSPAEWWKSYGSSTPNLQSFTIKVLSLTCSASGCERNWSIFEHIHSKKRNRLAQRRLNDLMFVKYNRALKRRYDARDRIDPISLKDIDDSNEWLMGRMDEESEIENELVFEDDDLTWDVVAQASGVGEATYNTRSIKGKNVTSSSTPIPGVWPKQARNNASTRLLEEDVSQEEYKEDDKYEEEQVESDEFGKHNDENLILFDDDS